MRGVVFDVGANDGTWARSWGKQLRRFRERTNVSLELLMLEPQPVFSSHLDAIAAEMPGATFVSAAAWKHDDTIAFSAPRSGSTAASIRAASGTGRREEEVAAQAGTSLRVRSVDLARLITTKLAAPVAAPASARIAVPAAAPLAESTVRNASESRQALSLMKLDVEGAEYELLPWLLAQGALCRLDFLIIEWHLNRLDLPNRLPALGFRLSLPNLLRAGCAVPPRLIEHDEPWEANTRVVVPGLHTLSMRHSYPNGKPPLNTHKYLMQDQTWFTDNVPSKQLPSKHSGVSGSSADKADMLCRGRPRCASSVEHEGAFHACQLDDMACHPVAIFDEVLLSNYARRVWLAANHSTRPRARALPSSQAQNYAIV